MEDVLRFRGVLSGRAERGIRIVCQGCIREPSARGSSVSSENGEDSTVSQRDDCIDESDSEKVNDRMGICWKYWRLMNSTLCSIMTRGKSDRRGLELCPIKYNNAV